MPDLEEDIPDCDACKFQYEQWQKRGDIRPKRSPVDEQWSRLFFYPRPAPGRERIRACPRGFVFGCPVLGTPPKDPRIEPYLGYHLYWQKGFSWDEFHEEPEHAITAMMVIEEESGRYLKRQQKKNESNIRTMQPQDSQTPELPKRPIRRGR